MGLMRSATLVRLSGSILKIKGNAPGLSVVSTAEGFDGQVVTPEVYQGAGVCAVPGDDTRAVMIPVGGSGRYSVVVACHNYNITLDITAGETAIFSTSADGKTLMGKIILRKTGVIEVNGNTKTFVTHAELNTALQAFVGLINGHIHTGTAAGFGIPFNTSTPTVPTTLDISAASTATVKTG